MAERLERVQQEVRERVAEALALAKLRRAGAVEIIRSDGELIKPYSPGVLEAGRYIAVKLGTRCERTDYMLSLCEELGVNAEAVYCFPRAHSDGAAGLTTSGSCRPSQTLNDWTHIAKPARRPALALEYLDGMNIRFGEFVQEFVDRHGDNFDLSLFSVVLEQQRAAGIDDYHRDIQTAALTCSSAAVLAWLVRGGHYDASRNTVSSLVPCGNETGLKLLLGQGFDINAANDKASSLSLRQRLKWWTCS